MRPQGELSRLAVRVLAALAAGLTVLFLAETLFELHRQGLAWSDLHSSTASGKALASTVSRAFNNLLAMVLSFVAIAIPITANMYTPKLIEIFFTDRVNLACLVSFAAMGAHAVFGQWAMFDQWAPQTHIVLLWLSGVVGFAVVLPYYLYVVEFLNPETIIRRVEERVVAAFPRGGHDLAAKKFLHGRILQLGNVILRSVERADRDVAIEAISSLERVVLRWAEHRPHVASSAQWHDVEREVFPGLATEAVGLLRRERNWVEYACLRQLHLAYIAALARMPDAVSAISQVNRRLAVHALRSGDDATVGLCVRYFNTSLRAAVAKRDVHAVYDVLRQYRALGIEMLSVRPQRSRDIVRHIAYYAELARHLGLEVVFDLAAADVASVAEAAHAARSPVAGDMLAIFLAFRPGGGSSRLVKSQASLAAWLRASGHEAQAGLVIEALRHATADLLRTARRDFEATDDPYFWEVTDRQINLDYLPPERRAQTIAVIDGLLAEIHGDAS